MTDNVVNFPPARIAEKVPVSILDFDDNNPRFTPDKRPTDSGDVAVIAMLAATADLAELIQAISTSGYINIEPLVVIQRQGRLTVLEGNRRLAAIKALRSPDVAKEARVAVPELTDQVRSSLEQILVYRVESEDEARDLIGFKHINGAQAWDAFAKACFAARWLEDENAKANADSGYPRLTLADIAGRMGDQHMTIYRMVAAKFVLDQAESNDVYRIEDRKKKSFSFSHLYTGLSYEEFANYLGMAKPDRTKDPAQEPVPTAKFQELHNLLVWLYGSKSRDIEPVIRSQNPDLSRLRYVLASKSATAILSQRNSLDEAETTATPVDIRFEKHLINANAELQHAVSALEGFDPASQPELQVIAGSALKKINIIKSSIDSALMNVSPQVKNNENHS
jgi:hypothetical protein